MNKFRSGIGKWLTRALFADVCIKIGSDVDPNTCPFWLTDNMLDDKRPVLRELFIATDDMTGFKLAQKYLGGWQHFQTLLKCKWFEAEFKKWTDELFVLQQSIALEKVREIAEGDGASALAASKYIANREWDKPQTTRGRPTKEEISGELKRQAEARTSKNDDYNRMTGFTVVQGGKS